MIRHEVWKVIRLQITKVLKCRRYRRKWKKKDKFSHDFVSTEMTHV